MTEDQRVIQTWQTPSFEDIAKLSRGHVAALQHSSDLAVWQPQGMHHVLLRTVGRRTGAEHFVALPIWRDRDGHPIVVASNAGAPQHPSWYLNLSDSTANPQVLCKLRTHEYWSQAQVLEGDDREQVWGMLTADRAWYADYQRATDRQIPLVRLSETHPA
jgi:deazaflavin-dependent oxidoreductase (nitroreductase family)